MHAEAFIKTYHRKHPLEHKSSKGKKSQNASKTDSPNSTHSYLLSYFPHAFWTLSTPRMGEARASRHVADLINLSTESLPPYLHLRLAPSCQPEPPSPDVTRLSPRSVLVPSTHIPTYPPQRRQTNPQPRAYYPRPCLSAALRSPDSRTSSRLERKPGQVAERWDSRQRLIRNDDLVKALTSPRTVTWSRCFVRRHTGDPTCVHALQQREAWGRPLQ